LRVPHASHWKISVGTRLLAEDIIFELIAVLARANYAAFS
jgi:hypothetical protein